MLLHRRDARRGEQVVACCEIASGAGVRPGMTLADAAASWKPGVRGPAIVPFDPPGDIAALGWLAEFCDRFSPSVGWETSAGGPLGRAAQPPWFGESPGHLFCDVTGVAGLFGGEDALAWAIAAALGELGYAVCIAIAPTLGAAWALASSDDPIVVVRSVDLDSALAPLPVSSLRLAADSLDMLGRLGVMTFEQLTRLSRVGLAERFGASLLFRLDQALGQATEMIVPHRPAPQYAAACELEYPTARRDLLERLAIGLIERLVGELRQRNAGALRLVGRFECGPASAVSFEIGLFRPSDSEQQLLDMLRLQWERLALPAPVRRIELVAEKTARIDWQPGEMFSDDCTGGPLLTALLERLSNRLGAPAIVRPELTADAAPERSFRYVPILGSRRRGSRAAPTAVSHRPLRLFWPAPRIDVEIHTGPTSFHWHSRRHDIHRIWGPERIETAWWRGDTVRRDYFRVETIEGNRFWLYRDRNTGSWHLHGSFE